MRKRLDRGDVPLTEEELPRIPVEGDVTAIFEGFLISDFKAIDDLPGVCENDSETSINAGMDTVMVPDRDQLLFNTLKELVEEVDRILDELERRMTFLCRRGGDDAIHPVTAEFTPHQVRYDGGEAFSAA